MTGWDNGTLVLLDDLSITGLRRVDDRTGSFEVGGDATRLAGIWGIVIKEDAQGIIYARVEG